MNAFIYSVIAVFVALFAVAQGPASPNVVFGAQGPSVAGLKPGTKLAWIALTRERVGHHGVLRTFSGLEVVTPAGLVAIGRPGAMKPRSLWLLASLDGQFSTASVPPGYAASSIPLTISAKHGDAAITIAAPAIEALYVRPHGGAWSVSAADGGTGDSDRQKDTTIRLALESLRPFAGNPKPPETAADGDLLLIIDPFDNRMAVVKVTR